MERALTHSYASSSCSCRSSSRLVAARPARATPRPSRGMPARAVLDLSRPFGDAFAAVRSPPPSVEPEQSTRVAPIHSPTEFEDLQKQHPDKLVVLMCKAKCCRPCKMFARKFSRIAEHYSDALFLDVYGDESKDTRQMMIKMGVKVTPYFALYRNGEKVHGHGGVNESNLHKAIQANLLESEAGFGTFAMASTSDDE